MTDQTAPSSTVTEDPAATYWKGRATAAWEREDYLGHQLITLQARLLDAAALVRAHAATPHAEPCHPGTCVRCLVEAFQTCIAPTGAVIEQPHVPTENSGECSTCWAAWPCPHAPTSAPTPTPESSQPRSDQPQPDRPEDT